MMKEMNQKLQFSLPFYYNELISQIKEIFPSISSFSFHYVSFWFIRKIELILFLKKRVHLGLSTDTDVHLGG